VDFRKRDDELHQIRMAIMMLESSVRRMKEEMQEMNKMVERLSKRVENVELNVSHLRQEVVRERMNFRDQRILQGNCSPNPTERRRSRKN
jgi:chromosome segregation ATPase